MKSRRNRGTNRGGGDWQARAAAWNVASTVNAGNFASIIIAGIPPAIQPTSNPIVGALRVHEIDSTVDVVSGSGNGTCYVAAGIFKAQFDDTTGNFVTRSLFFNAKDVQEPWFDVETRGFFAPTAGTVTNMTSIRLFRMKRKLNVRLNQGEALVLVIDNSTASAGLIAYATSSRVKVSNEL
jgi:hypothetical protein